MRLDYLGIRYVKKGVKGLLWNIDILFQASCSYAVVFLVVRPANKEALHTLGLISFFTLDAQSIFLPIILRGMGWTKTAALLRVGFR